MPSESFSYTGTQFATRLKNMFGDTGNVVITDAMILDWLNDGIRAIGAEAYATETILTTNLVGGTAAYDINALFSTSRIQQIKQITANGFPVGFLTFAEYQAYVATQAAQAQTGAQPKYWTQYGSSVTFWPVPNATKAGGIVIYATVYAADLTALSQTLTLPDRYMNSLQDWVLAQARRSIEDFQGGDQLEASAHRKLSLEFERSKRNPTDQYPAMRLDPYDNDDGYVDTYANYLP